MVIEPNSAFDGRPALGARRRAPGAVAFGAAAAFAVALLAAAPPARADASPQFVSAALDGATQRAPAPLGAPAPSQGADTDQSSSADARVNQPQQTNVVVVIRIDSPGDDTITQTNVIGVGATSSNDSSTQQVQSPQAPAGIPAAASGTAAAAATAPAPPASPPPPAAPPEQSASAASAGDTQPPAPATPSQGTVVLADYVRTSAAPASARELRSPPSHEAVTRRPPAKPVAAARASAVAPPHAVVAPAVHPSARHAQRTAFGAVVHAAARIPAQAVQNAPRLLDKLGEGGGGSAASAALAADSGSNGSSLGVATLAALLAGLVAWGLLALGPRRPLTARARRRGR